MGALCGNQTSGERVADHPIKTEKWLHSAVCASSNLVSGTLCRNTFRIIIAREEGLSEIIHHPGRDRRYKM
jgi:hypothetical protein